MAEVKKGTCVQLYPSDIEQASRIIRTCTALHESQLFDEVIFLGASETHEDATPVRHPGGFLVQHFHRSVDRQAGFVQKALWTRAHSKRLIQRCVDLNPSVIAIRTLAYLATGVEVKKRTGAKLIYDIHELETETEGLGSKKKALYKFLERKFISSMDGAVVVADGIADWYRDTYSMPRPAVVRAVPDADQSLLGRFPESVKSLLNVPEAGLLFAYVGLLETGRQIQEILESFETAPQDKHVLFLGMGSMEGVVQEAARKHTNIHFLSAVAPNEVVSRLEGIDVGIVGVGGGGLSHRFALPNKFFQPLFAGAPVIVPNRPEMAGLVQKLGCGWVLSDAPNALQQQLAAITRTDVEEKRMRVPAAKAEFSWLKERETLVNAYARLVQTNR